MDFQLKGKLALVSGAAKKGLGRAHALALAGEGVNVALLDIESCEETAQLLREKKIEAKSYQADISNPSQIKEIVSKIEEEMGTVQILINNAAILSTVGMFQDIPDEKFQRDIEVNLMGSVNLTRAIWPGLLKNKWGRVVFISSFAGTHGGAGQSSYAATKAALIGFGKSLALEGARYNITSNIVAPGITRSETLEKMIRSDMLERMKQKIALRRLAEIEEVASVVTFLCSHQASYITGQVIEIDGGLGLFTF